MAIALILSRWFHLFHLTILLEVRVRVNFEAKIKRATTKTKFKHCVLIHLCFWGFGDFLRIYGRSRGIWVSILVLRYSSDKCCVSLFVCLSATLAFALTHLSLSLFLVSLLLSVSHTCSLSFSLSLCLSPTVSFYISTCIGTCASDIKIFLCTLQRAGDKESDSNALKCSITFTVQININGCSCFMTFVTEKWPDYNGKPQNSESGALGSSLAFSLTCCVIWDQAGSLLESVSSRVVNKGYTRWSGGPFSVSDFLFLSLILWSGERWGLPYFGHIRTQFLGALMPIDYICQINVIGKSPLPLQFVLMGQLPERTRHIPLFIFSQSSERQLLKAFADYIPLGPTFLMFVLRFNCGRRTSSGDWSVWYVAFTKNRGGLGSCTSADWLSPFCNL